MRLISFLFILFISTISFGQEKVITTDSFSIEGKVKKGIHFSVSSLDSFPAEMLGDITTVNHRGEVKTNRKRVKGILLKSILTGITLDYSKPKELNSYYFVLVGADGYKMVLSYSEIFNSSHVYIITESNGKNWKDIEDRVAVLVLMEDHKGHIAMKGLDKLLVQQVL